MSEVGPLHEEKVPFSVTKPHKLIIKDHFELKKVLLLLTG